MINISNPICPKCNKAMQYFGDCGAYPSDGFTCDNCMDWAYDEEGRTLWQWE